MKKPRNPIAKVVTHIRRKILPNKKRKVKESIEEKEFLQQLKTQELRYKFYE